MLALFLFIFAIVFFIIAGFVAVPEPWHNRLVCFGLACLAGAELVSKIPALTGH
jgi:hypothetical protein